MLSVPSPVDSCSTNLRVDISELGTHLESLPEDERIEQVRDWALLGAYPRSVR